MWTLADTKDVATIVAAVGGIIAACVGLFQYWRNNMLKRAELFFAMEDRLQESNEFRKIIEFLEKGDPALEQVPLRDRIHFLGVYEQVAIMVNSGLMQPELASYMFGAYAVCALDNEHMWSGLDMEDPYWSAFRRFAEQMKAQKLAGGMDASRVRV